MRFPARSRLLEIVSLTWLDSIISERSEKSVNPLDDSDEVWRWAPRENIARRRRMATVRSLIFLLDMVQLKVGFLILSNGIKLGTNTVESEDFAILEVSKTTIIHHGIRNPAFWAKIKIAFINQCWLIILLGHLR